MTAAGDGVLVSEGNEPVVHLETLGDGVLV